MLTTNHMRRSTRESVGADVLFDVAVDAVDHPDAYLTPLLGAAEEDDDDVVAP